MNGHEYLPTDFEIFSTETENFSTDNEILLTRFNYDRNIVGKTQQKWNFSIQDPTESENSWTRSNRHWKLFHKTYSRLNRNEILFPRFKMTKIFEFKTGFQTLDITWTSSACHSDTIFLFTAAQLKTCQWRIEYYAARKTICIFSEAHNFGTHQQSKLKFLLDNLHYLDYLAHTSTVVFGPWKAHFGQSERSIYTGTQFWEVSTSFFWPAYLGYPLWTLLVEG